MSELKMSGAFVLPVSSHKGYLFNSKNPISDTRICKFFNMNQFESAKLAAHAINSHDKLVEENKRLRGAIHKACSESCNIATCGTIMMSADLFNGLVDAYNGCEETKECED